MAVFNKASLIIAYPDDVIIIGKSLHGVEEAFRNLGMKRYAELRVKTKSMVPW